MLPWICEWLSQAGLDAHFLGLSKTTGRAALAAAGAWSLALFLLWRAIPWLKARCRERIRTDSAQLYELHQGKGQTPTLGGAPVVGAVVAMLLLLGDLDNVRVWSAVALALGLGLVGLVDDLTKARGKRHGISRRQKLLGQAAAAVVCLLVLSLQSQLAEDFSPWRWALAVLVIVGSSNAVNLTDGLDGLAGGCLIAALAALGIVAYASGHAELAEYFHLPNLPGAHETLVIVAAAIGGLLAFLWFNCHPAQIFLGDTGALPLGGLLGWIAVSIRQEWLLAVVGGVFVVETLSVIVQVAVFRWKQRRVLRCAPLHHHFQFQGWPENKIVVRFWIASAFCALAGLAMLRTGVLAEPRSPAAAVTARPTSAVVQFATPATVGDRSRPSAKISSRQHFVAGGGIATTPSRRRQGE